MRDRLSRRDFLASATAMGLSGPLLLRGLAEASPGAGRTALPLGANAHYPSFGDGLAPTPYTKLPLGHVKARGWLHDQLQRAADGMTGRLDEHYPVVGPDNAWRGGHGDNWERGPYWLDGLVPLAHLLDSDELKTKAEPFIEYTMQSRQKNGFFGPGDDIKRLDKPGYQVNQYSPADWWPRMIMGKVLISHYEATGDERVIDLLTNYFRYQLKHLPETKLGHYSWWANRRGGENELIAYWLYQRTGDDFLLELGELLHKQTRDWTSIFADPEKIDGQHGVNLAMAFKQPAVSFLRSKEPRELEVIDRALNYVKANYGQPNAMFEGDELLDVGRNPTLGTETCTVVESMFSYEKLAEITGRVDYLDLLERVAYNALPAAARDDFMTRQYYQQTNQIAITRQAQFGTHHGDDLCYGLVSGYPCCTVNMHQGWPKFVEHLWMASADNGLAALAYGPSEVTAKVGDGREVRIEEKTEYPFEHTIRFVMHTGDAVTFPLHLRIPQWAEGPTIRINGKDHPATKGGEIVRIERQWSEGDQLTLELPTSVSMSQWHNGSVAVERGPLVYAMPIEGDWQKLDEEYGIPLWGSEPKASFNKALVVNPKTGAGQFKTKVSGIRKDKWPWSPEGAPIRIETTAMTVPDWGVADDGTAQDPPKSPVQQDTQGDTGKQTIALIPYGSTDLRITEFPWMSPQDQA